VSGVFTHHSARPVERVRSVAQKVGETGRKPSGFWISRDGDDSWEAWCRSEEYWIGSLAVRHEVRLAEHASILSLSTAKELEGFTEQYGLPEAWASYSIKMIDWSRVAAEYSGIMIVPYIWSCRLDGPASGWYYSWDCASGCIWDASAIASIAPVREPALARGQA